MDITAIAVAKGQATAEAQKQEILDGAKKDILLLTKEAAAKFISSDTDEAYRRFLEASSPSAPPKLRNRQPDMPEPQPMPLARMKTGCFLSL